MRTGRRIPGVIGPVAGVQPHEQAVRLGEPLELRQHLQRRLHRFGGIRRVEAFVMKEACIFGGEYGAALFTRDSYFAIPAYPLESVFDPTGAGDTFAGGFMGYLASQEKIDESAMRRAMIFGSVMASFNVEEFGTERVRRLTHAEINDRFRAFKRMTHFDEIPFEVR